MSLQEEENFKNEVINSIISNPENALINFKKNWNNLVFESKRNLAPFIMKFCTERVNSENFNPQRPENYEITKLCANAIYNIINDDFSGKPDFGHLKLGKNIKPVDIAAVFKILYDIEYIDNSLNEIAEIIKQVFNLKDNTTVESYLEENTKLNTACTDYLTKIKSSQLVQSSAPPF